MRRSILRKISQIVAFLLVFLSSAKGQSEFEPTVGDPLSNIDIPGLTHPLIVDGITFFFVWIIVYTSFALIIKLWVKALNNASSTSSWGDEFEKILFGSSGSGVSRQASGKNLLLWITGLGNLILVITVEDFLVSIRALIAAFGIGGFYLLLLLLGITMIAVFGFLLGLFGYTGGAVSWGYGKSKPKLKDLGNEMSNGYKKGKKWGSKAWEEAKKKTGRLQQLLGRNSYIRQSFKKFDELQKKAGWHVKFCPKCGTANNRTNDNCGNCGRNFYFG